MREPRDAHANALAEEYVKRIRRSARLEMCTVKPERSELWVKHASAWKVLLDPAGKPMLSTGFAGMVSKAELEASDLVFVIGGADGLPAEWRGHADVLLSLSAMTFPHELARVGLAEKIDRAFAILRGHPHPQWRTNRARGPKKHLAARNPSPGPPQPTLPAVA